MKSRRITQDELKDLVLYDEVSGFFYWKSRAESLFSDSKKYSASRICASWNKKNAGKQFGIVDSRTGYVIITINGVAHTAHRLAFLYMTGESPEQVDHIDHVRTNNAWENLRSANHQINARNCPLYSNNSSGVAGVNYHKGFRKWMARIVGDGKRLSLGFFENKEDAVLARKNAELLYGYHKNHGSTMRFDK